MIIAQFYPSIGGAEQECRKIAKQLKKTGHEVSVLTQYREDLPAYELIDGVPVYRKIRGWHWYELSYMLSVLILLFRYRKILMSSAVSGSTSILPRRFLSGF
jgi:hypothetical protein